MTDRSAVHQAAALVEAGSPAAAMRVLTPYLATEPDDPYALCVGAQSLIKLDDPTRAMQLAQRAATLSPSDDWPIRLQALAYREQERFVDAQLAARHSVQVNPSNWQTHYLVALADVWADNVTTHSMAAVERARELAPDQADTHRLLGSVALELGRPRVATKALEQALRLDPEDAAARHELARAHMRQFRFGAALRGFLAVGQLDPTISQTWINLHNLIIRAVVVLHFTLLITLISSEYIPVETGIGVLVVAIGVSAFLYRRGGRALLRVGRTIWSADRFLAIWALLLLAAAVIVVVRPLLFLGQSWSSKDPPYEGLLLAGRVLILGGTVVSWLRRSRLRPS